MFDIYFNQITVSRANRYVLLLKTQQETKRSEICSQWTSNPIFAQMKVAEVAGMELKLCQASLDRKIRVVGVAVFREDMFDLSSQVIFQGEVKLEQEVEGKNVCVGLAHIKIAREREEEIVTSKVGQNAINAQHQEEEDYELDKSVHETEEEELDNDEIRVEVHCGFNFYLGSQFYVEVQWGNSQIKTRGIKDKINPVWAQGGRIQGVSSKPITIRIKDSKNNILQSFKFLLSNLRTLFPYHIRLIFKEEYMGAIPQVYLSLIRESNARHSITELPLKFGLKNLGDTLKNVMYLMVTLDPTQKVPKFIPLDRNKYGTLEQTNEYLTKRTLGEEQRVDLIGLSSNTEKGLSIFKSYLTRKIYVHLISINDCKAWFVGHNWQGCKVIESKPDFQSILKRVYYQGEPFTLKKLLEFFNPNTVQADTQGKSSIQRWKLQTRNYILRNKLVNNSTKHIQQLKLGIEEKGKELVELKKILAEIKRVNFSLIGKEKIMNAIKNRAKNSKMYAKEIDTGALISSLYQKQSILEGQKRINSELALRMDSLVEVQQNQKDLDFQITSNASKLLKLQSKISKMTSMQQSIKKQRLIIGQLQKIFEKSEMDKRVNEALKAQREKLNSLKEKKQNQLKNVYRIIKENNAIGGNLAVKVKHAEETLIKLNEQYARLTGL